MDEKWRTKYWGKYLGIVRDYYDPENLGRLKIEIPEIYGVGEEKWSPWALPCLPPGRYDTPEEGEAVWVEFRNGDPDKPIWVGWLPRGTGETSALPERAKLLCEEPPDVLPELPEGIIQPGASLSFRDIPEPCEDCRERIGEKHDVNDEIYYDHLPFHDHREGFYHCPRVGRYVLVPTKSGHAIHFSDKNMEEYLQIIDSQGNKISLWHDFYGGIWMEDKAGNIIRIQYNIGTTLVTANGHKIEMRNYSEKVTPGEGEATSGIFIEDATGAKITMLAPEDADVTSGGPAVITLDPGEGNAVLVNGNLVVAGVPYAPTPVFAPI